VFIALLMAAYVAGYAWSAPHTDTADEILKAYGIRHGIEYPAEGPFLGNAIHLGPAWFYLTAAPLWVSQSWLAPALFVGLLCSLKFPLAYACGWRLLDREFGLLWAAALFAPGFTSIETLIFLNPNAVAAAVLAILAVFLYGLREPTRPMTFAVMGLVLGLAIHVHPTSLPAFLLAAILLVRHYRRSHEIVRPVLAVGLGFVLPFVPYVVSQAVNGFPDWVSTSSYMAGQIVPANAIRAPDVVANYLFTGPSAIAQYVMGWNPPAAIALGVFSCVLAASSMAVLVIPSVHIKGTRYLAIFASAFILFAATVAALRPTTPFQFTYVLAPAAAGLAAVGLWALASIRYLRPIVWLAAIAMVAINLMAIRAMALMARDGEGRLPSRIMDIKGALPVTVYRDVWFPALRHDELGRFLCDAKGRTSLHGHLAYVIDKDLGLDTLLECNDRSRFVLGGMASASRQLGMTRPFWRALDTTPPRWIGSLGVTDRFTPLAPRDSLAIADGSTYLPRKSAQRAATVVTIEVDAREGDALLITNMLGNYEHFRVVSATVGGTRVSPIAENDLSVLYRGSKAGDRNTRWTFSVESTNPAGIDVVAIDTRPGKP
jgi:hypothetical protein